jgi:predicted DNA-binding transcriptional regulator YafY
VADRLPATAGVLEAEGAQRCILRTTTDSLEWLAMFIGVLGVDFTVVEPAELTHCIRAIAERFTRASV